MNSSFYRTDFKTCEKLLEAMKAYEGNVEDEINNVFWTTGAERIESEIIKILPRSRRSWKGKATAAADTNPFRQEDGNLFVIVRSKKNYQYLYFPDDGSNTLRHNGGQEFMRRGAERAESGILQRCLDALEKINN